jgi:2-methylcitrate dehydratase PrpD
VKCRNWRRQENQGARGSGHPGEISAYETVAAPYSATMVAAGMMGWQDLVGSIATGKYADFVAVAGNTLDDTTEPGRVKFVTKDGEVVKKDPSILRQSMTARIMSIATELAERICNLQYGDLPEQAVNSAKMAILDTVGVTLAGSREQATRIVERTLGAGEKSGPCLVYGGHRRTTCLDAALINGVAAHVLDFDDCSNTLGGHPSAPILPGLLALAEDIGASGREVLLAYIVGFETEARIARGVNFHHYQKGWHPTATLGIFGAAAACGRLLKLAPERVATALALSVSLAAGVKANFGTMTKSLHIGQCSRNGLFAALLARDGFTANPEAFEHRQGFLNVFNGAGTFDANKILDHWADPLDIVDPGIAIKQYPCCGSTHPAIDAAMEIFRAQRIDLSRLSQIEVWIHARRLEHTNRPDPKSALEAKFSVQYCVARALMHGKVGLEHFEGVAFRDPNVRRISGLVNAAPYTDQQFDPVNHFGGEVKVTLADGKSHSAKVQSASGRTSESPLSEEQLRTKFENCARRALTREQVSLLYQSIENFEGVPSVRDLTAQMASVAPVERSAG